MGFNCSCLSALKVIIFVNHPIFYLFALIKSIAFAWLFSLFLFIKFTISNIINFSTQCKTKEESWLSFTTVWEKVDKFICFSFTGVKEKIHGNLNSLKSLLPFSNLGYLHEWIELVLNHLYDNSQVAHVTKFWSFAIHSRSSIRFF